MNKHRLKTSSGTILGARTTWLLKCQNLESILCFKLTSKSHSHYSYFKRENAEVADHVPPIVPSDVAMEPFLGRGCRWCAQLVSCHQVVEGTSTCNAAIDVGVRKKLNQKDLDHEEDEVRHNLGIRRKWTILVATLDKSNTHDGGALALEHLVNVV
jgi:hypothetical protein